MTDKKPTAAELARERRKQKLLKMEGKLDKPYEAPKKAEPVKAPPTISVGMGQPLTP